MIHSSDTVAIAAQVFREFAQKIDPVFSGSGEALNDSQNYGLAVIGLILVLSVVCSTCIITRIFVACCNRVVKKEAGSQSDTNIDEDTDADNPSHVQCGIVVRSDSEESDEGEMDRCSMVARERSRKQGY
jgi:hypothetical protein